MCVCVCVNVCVWCYNAVLDVRWKNKFWGKSMEILPIGTVNVMLPRYQKYELFNLAPGCLRSKAYRLYNVFPHLTYIFPHSYGDHYEWNKVTTCVHNILSGRRWIEHYGEITIRNTKSSTCICKLTFIKVLQIMHPLQTLICLFFLLLLTLACFSLLFLCCVCSCTGKLLELQCE